MVLTDLQKVGTSRIGERIDAPLNVSLGLRLLAAMPMSSAPPLPKTEGLGIRGLKQVDLPRRTHRSRCHLRLQIEDERGMVGRAGQAGAVVITAAEHAVIDRRGAKRVVKPKAITDSREPCVIAVEWVSGPPEIDEAKFNDPVHELGPHIGRARRVPVQVIPSRIEVTDKDVGGSAAAAARTTASQ